jgi:hypothetical protein
MNRFISVFQLLVIANYVASSLILVTLMMVAIRSSETSVIRNLQEYESSTHLLSILDKR